jgi:hypothetical protein
VRWSTEDFESMCWHDVHVHALRFEEGEQGEGELVLDIDYILEWHCQEPQFSFRVAPAKLRFHGISNLRVTLDYATPSAGICPFSLAGITREVLTYANGFQSFRWLLKINWPDGEISFYGLGFTQDLAGPEVTTTSQSLSPAERSGAAV